LYFFAPLNTQRLKFFNGLEATYGMPSALQPFRNLKPSPSTPLAQSDTSHLRFSFNAPRLSVPPYRSDSRRIRKFHPSNACQFFSNNLLKSPD
jgi:hypothetical protein